MFSINGKKILRIIWDDICSKFCSHFDPNKYIYIDFFLNNVKVSNLFVTCVCSISCTLYWYIVNKVNQVSIWSKLTLYRKLTSWLHINLYIYTIQNMYISTMLHHHHHEIVFQSNIKIESQKYDCCSNILICWIANLTYIII